MGGGGADGTFWRIATRFRLDAELVRRHLADDRDSARALIDARQVHVNGAFADKPTRLVDRGDSIELVPEPPAFVSRGGDKLAHALDEFEVDPRGKRCLDAGASTGGFTDCLIQRGAMSVVAVDVGYGQLHESLVANPAVVNHERTNIRYVTAEALGGVVDLVVGDLSFISLGLVLEALVGLTVPGVDIVLLVKPQFEASREEAAIGRGVIRDRTIWRRVLGEVADAAAVAGAGIQNVTVSPIRGGSGNVEFLVHLVAGHAAAPLDLDDIIDRASIDG